MKSRAFPLLLSALMVPAWLACATAGPAGGVQGSEEKQEAKPVLVETSPNGIEKDPLALLTGKARGVLATREDLTSPAVPPL
jgi:hypothetical protein